MRINGVAIAIPALTSLASATSYPPFYDTTWAGPVRLAENFTSSPNASTGFTSVEGTFVIPKLALPQNPREEVDEYTASAWIGLDGFLPSTSTSATVARGLWQAGVIMSIWGNGTTQYSGFYEWVPSDPVSLTKSELEISEGDYVRVVVHTTAAGYYGTTTFENLNTSQSFAYSQDAPVAWRGPTFIAPGSSAEWIIEEGTYLNGTQYVVPNWGNASIVNARACYSDGECVVPGSSDATAENSRMTVVLWNDTQIVNTRSVVEDDKIWIAYVEEAFDS